MIAGQGAHVVPPMVSSYTPGWGVHSGRVTSSAPVSGTYESANRGVWYPLRVPRPYLIRRFWWVNGSWAWEEGYQIEVGVYYDANGKPGKLLITTGAVDISSASSLQFQDVTDTWLQPTRAWLYISVASATPAVFRSTAALSDQGQFISFQQASVGPGSAPDPAVPAERESTGIWLFGITNTTWT